TGRIRRADVLAAARPTPRGVEPTRGMIPLTPIRRTIASRLAEGSRTTTPVTLTTTIGATNLVGLRDQFKATACDVPSVTDVVVKLCALALRDHPILQARCEGDRLVFPEDVHIGFAVDTEAGLLVPVIRAAAALGVKEIAARSRDFE